MVETRRGSSSKRASFSPPPPTNSKRPKASESSSSISDIRSPPSVPVKQSGSESRDLVLRSPDLPNTDLLNSANASDVIVSEKSPEVGADCVTLVPPQPLAETATDLEKPKAVCRGKKCQTKTATKLMQKLPWGKLLSQCPEVENACVA